MCVLAELHFQSSFQTGIDYTFTFINQSWEAKT